MYKKGCECSLFDFLFLYEQLFKLLSLLVLGVLTALVAVLIDWEGSFTSLLLELLVIFVH